MASSRYERVFQWQLWTCFFSFWDNIISAALCFSNYMLIRVTITLGPRRCNPRDFNLPPSPPPHHPDHALPDLESEDDGSSDFSYESGYDRSVHLISYYEASESEPFNENDDLDLDDDSESPSYDGNANGHDGDGGCDSDTTSETSDTDSISWLPIPPSTRFSWLPSSSS